MCFFTIHCNPCLAYIAVRDLQSSQRNASVQLLLLAGNVQPIAAECWRGRGGKLSRILGNNTIFNEQPVCLLFYCLPVPLANIWEPMMTWPSSFPGKNKHYSVNKNNWSSVPVCPSVRLVSLSAHGSCEHLFFFTKSIYQRCWAASCCA